MYLHSQVRNRPEVKVKGQEAEADSPSRAEAARGGIGGQGEVAVS